MDLGDLVVTVLRSGIDTGTVLLFATIGEILTERSGVLNLGVEGMMLMGAMSAFSVAVSLGNPWLGILVAMTVAGLAADAPVEIDTAEAAGVTFPGFWDTMRSLGADITIDT